MAPRATSIGRSERSTAVGQRHRRQAGHPGAVLEEQPEHDQVRWGEGRREKEEKGATSEPAPLRLEIPVDAHLMATVPTTRWGRGIGGDLRRWREGASVLLRGGQPAPVGGGSGDTKRDSDGGGGRGNHRSTAQ